MPVSLTTLSCAYNNFSSGLTLLNVPPNLVTLNISGNSFRRASIGVNNLTLSSKDRLANTLILDITANDIICPFPGVGEITAANDGSNLVIFKDGCRTDLSPYLIPAVVIVSVVVLFVSILLMIQSCREKLIAVYMRLTVFIFLFGYFATSQLGRVFDILSYMVMYRVGTTQSPDNCAPVNTNGVYLPLMETWSNNDGTIFPFRSCVDPTLEVEPACPMVQREISNFTVFITLVLDGWPGQQFPDRVQSGISSFQNLCNGFVKVNQIEECEYNPVVYACERVRDGTLDINIQFLSFIRISMALIAVGIY